MTGWRQARASVAVVVMLGLVSGVAAQRTQGDAAWPSATLDQRQRDDLQRQLATPVPAELAPVEVRRRMLEQLEAAVRLGEPALQQQVLRSAMQRLPSDSRWPNDLAWLMFDQQQHAEALQLFDRAIALATRPVDRLFFESNRLALLVSRRQPDVAAQVADLRQRAQALLASLPTSVDRVTVLRLLGNLSMRDAEIAGQQVLLNEALAARAESERLQREAFDTLAAVPVAAQGNAVRRNATTSLANAQRERGLALMRLGRYVEAETVLVAHAAFVREQSLPPMALANAHHALGQLRLYQGLWSEAAQQIRQSTEVLDRAGVPRSHPFQVIRTRDLALVLWARGETADARAALDAMDAQAQRDQTPPGRTRLPFERGLVLLAGSQPREAVRLFESLAGDNLKQLGPGHFYTAQAQGLHGAALWATGEATQRERASELLKQAALDLLSPRNVDWLNDAGVRRPVRELIFKAYLDAMAWRGGLQAMVALGVADRLMSGSTSQAVADAAVRAAAGDPALAGLVRQEQDLRQQLQALRSDDSAVLDDTQRRRANDLELQRQQVQETLRARFPGYDQLTRPPLASATEVAQRLRRDEVLLLALPTERALYLWAVSADELPMFVRVDVERAQLAALVARLRKGLDFSLNGGRADQFDADAARELHRLVLAPVAQRLKGRQQLVVVASGPLAQLPLAVLQSGPPNADGPAWVVRQLAISQVPSVSAWLTLRQSPPARPAPEPLMAWADPRFAGADASRAARARPRNGQAGEAMRYQDLPPLPETRDEVLAIARALRADPERDLLVGPGATRDSVLAANRSGQLARKRVLVFATHGLIAGDLPGLSQPALALASGGQGDGPLSAVIGLDDVLGLKLNADWVVLSACNTAAGDGRAEEALSGLARGFLYAGTRSLLVTHWAVESESAKLLTSATFEHQATHPQAAKVESLRQAMLKLMANPKYAHPAYWAPYVLVGDGTR